MATEWYTPALEAFTLGGKAKFNIRALESSAAANASLKAEIAVCNGDGSSSVVWGVGFIEPLTTAGEVGTTDAAYAAWVSGDDVAVTAGQRLRFRIYVDDTASGPLVAGHTVTVSYNGGTPVAAGDTWVTLTALVVEQSTGPATVQRTAALTATGLIATIGRERLARTAALNATGLVASSGVRVAPATQRSAALTATGLIATVGRELLPRAAAANAAGSVSVAGQVIHVRQRAAALTATGLIATAGRETLARSAALNATGGIATVGRETLSRSAALAATAAVASAGREQLARLVELAAAAQVSVSGQVEGGLVVVSRSASLSATGVIASGGRELLPRRVVVTATASIATVARRRLHRSSAVASGGQVTVAGEILGAVSRAAQLTATTTVATRPQRAFARSATVTTAPTVAAVGRRTLSRTAAVGAAAAITTTTGKTGQAEFTAAATITLSRYLEPGYLTSTRPGRIAVIYHGQLDGGSLGGLELPGPDEGELAVGTVGGIARTGG